MNKEIIMPALGMAQQTGVLTRWLKREGEHVVKGEPLMEIETDKVTVEIDAPASGILTDVTAAERDEIPVGQTIGLIVTLDETDNQPTTPNPSTTGSNARLQKSQKVSPVAARMAREHRIDLHEVSTDQSRVTKTDVEKYLERESLATTRIMPASPKARRLANENSLELNGITATGPDGAVLAEDIRSIVTRQNEAATIKQSAPTAPANHVLEPSRAWETMARRMTESWHGAPHFFVMRDVNATRLQEWYLAAKTNASEKITYTDLLVKVIAIALRKHPRLNAHHQDGTIILNTEINICLAVATHNGLITPVIRTADSLTIREIAVRRNELIGKTHANQLQLDDVSGGTFTISNLGMYNVDAFTAIINPPQAAILAVGRLADRVVPVDGVPVVCPQMTMTLSCDHRIVDGAGAAAFLDDLSELIKEPLKLIN